MTTSEEVTRSVVVERELAHPPEKVWRALTDSSLMEQWLMKNDFQPVAGREFKLRREPMPNWDGVIDCQVRAVDFCKTLSYTWGTLGLETVVTWTLTPTAAGTHLRMEQSGFGPDREANYKGARYGWKSNMDGLERVLEQIQS
jgi:uncharacterized protein YndB with AHSA1/START domain